MGVGVVACRAGQGLRIDGLIMSVVTYVVVMMSHTRCGTQSMVSAWHAHVEECRSNVSSVHPVCVCACALTCVCARARAHVCACTHYHGYASMHAWEICFMIESFVMAIAGYERIADISDIDSGSSLLPQYMFQARTPQPTFLF
jgi:hypothetical protein